MLPAFDALCDLHMGLIVSPNALPVQMRAIEIMWRGGLLLTCAAAAVQATW